MHTLLTGPKAARRAEEGGGVDGEGIREILDGLQRCWEDLESVKRPGAIDMEVDSQVERFASAWQVSNLPENHCDQVLMPRYPLLDICFRML